MAELTESDVARALRHAEVPEAPVRYDPVTDSTNATALAMAREGAPEWTVVAAGHQTSGRGRLGRTWVSEPGSALLFSVVLRPELPPAQAVLLTLLAGTAMAHACGDSGAPEVRCKWPNDLLLGEAKVGGILAEAAVAGGRIEHVVIGLGVNLGSAPDVEGAGALPGVGAPTLLASFFAELWGDYGAGSRRPGFAERIVDAYRPLCATIGRRVRATTTGGDTVEGTALDVDRAGSLVVETAEGRATVGFGEVHHLR
jgi:BirA family biotin operon repressor/biotin-[acetyl-CoA-carboxylase] ligase